MEAPFRPLRRPRLLRFEKLWLNHEQPSCITQSFWETNLASGSPNCHKINAQNLALLLKLLHDWSKSEILATKLNRF